MKNLIPDRLRELRSETNYLQSEVADLIGVNRSTYGAYERGVILPPMDKLQRLADLFRVSVDYLVGNTDSRLTVQDPAPDAADMLKELLRYLGQDSYTLTLDGRNMSHLSRETLREYLEAGLRLARMMNRGE